MLAKCTMEQLKEFFDMIMDDGQYIQLVNDYEEDIISYDSSYLIYELKKRGECNNMYIIENTDECDDFLDSIEDPNTHTINDQLLNKKVKNISDVNEIFEYTLGGKYDYMYIGFSPYISSAYTVLIKEINYNDKGEALLY